MSPTSRVGPRCIKTANMARGRASSVLSGAVLLALGLLLFAVGCSLAPSAPEPRTRGPLPTLAPAASPAPSGRSGGRVTVYSALSEATNSAIVAAFRRAHPVIDIEVLSLAAAGDLQAHIRAERNSPRADIFLGGSSEYHDPLAKEGLLEAYHSPGAASVDPALKDPNGHWTGWYLGIFGILLNQERWAGEMGNRDRPSTWDDLLDPAFAGQIAMPDPVKTGGGYIFLANQLFRFSRNEARAMDYMRKLHLNIGEYTETSPATIDLVARGQYLLGLNWGHDVLTAAAEGKPVQFLAPEETAFEVGAVSIVKGGPNGHGARAFVDWVLSRESAELIVRLSNRLSTVRRVEPVAGAPTLETVKLVRYDRAWATQNRDQLLRHWQMAVE